MIVVFFVLLAGCFAWGVRRYRTHDGLDPEDRLVAAALPTAYCLLTGVYLGQILGMLFDDWNACRLAPTMALRYGYALYYLPEEGPILGMLYGPFTAVAYLPALVAKTPTQALLIAGLLTVSFVLMPLWFLNRYVGPGASSDQRINRHVVFLFAAAALLLHPSTAYLATNLHADAPAVGFGLFAWVVVLGVGDRLSWKRLALSAAFVSAAALSKQFELVLVVALAVYAALCFGPRRAAGFLLAAAVFSVALMTIFGLLWGFDALVQATVVLPLRHPRREWIPVFGDFYHWVRDGTGILLIVLVGVLAAVERSRRSLEAGKRALLKEPIAALILAALFLVPTSVLAVARFGAEANANHWIYYLVAAASLTLSRLAAVDADPSLERLAKRAVYAIAGATLVLVLPELQHLRRIEVLGTNPQQQAYAFARRHPGEVYFPWHPLSTLMAEGKAYHFEYGIFDRELVGVVPSCGHFRAYLPAKLRWIAFRGQQPRAITKTLQYLPEFSDQQTLPDLPGWTLRSRGK